MDCSRDELLETLSHYAIAPLFNKVMQDLVDSSSSSSSDSDDDDQTNMILNIMDFVDSTRDIDFDQPLDKSGALLDLCLKLYKSTCPKEFRKYARMDPGPFDILVQTLENEETFHNHSSNSQIPVDRQVLLALIRFASYGNEASISKISALCGVSTGTVDLVTRRVVKAIQSSNLRLQHIRWPTGQEKEAAKDWVEEQAGLSAWRGGFCMVNGTSIPLYQQPSYDGGTFEDSSINLQIINTPNRHIIDYGSGVRGSPHDDQCFQSTRLGQRPAELLNEDEWCWADQGYHLTKWLILPYEQPADQFNENRVFNHHLSKIRTPCEQTIGYLRGRFQSLKELRIRIRTAKDLDYAIAWIDTCIVLHAFCMDQESDIDQEWLKDGQEFERGLLTRPALPHETTQSGGSALNKGEEAREDLKSLLLEALD